MVSPCVPSHLLAECLTFLRAIFRISRFTAMITLRVRCELRILRFQSGMLFAIKSQIITPLSVSNTS